MLGFVRVDALGAPYPVAAPGQFQYLVQVARRDGDGDDAQTVSGASDDTWESRTLCVDESCIGVVGPDGRCKECGLPYDP